MAVVERRVLARHSVASHEQRPVEAAAVVRHEPAVARNPRGELGQERRLVGVIRQQQLGLPEQAALPPPEPDEEREGPGGRREAGRLGVQAEQGSVGGRLSGQSGEALAIHWQDRSRRLDHDERTE
jgi:hypothetical protein